MWNMTLGTEAKAEPPEAKPAPNGADNSTAMDQVRELLFGEAKRNTEARLDDIDFKIEVLKEDIATRFAALEARLADQGQETDRKHLNTVDAIGQAIADLGAAIRSMATTDGEGR